MSEVEIALEALLFGSTWYFGILIFIIVSIAIMKLWKYAGALIIPMIIALEVQYYNRLADNIVISGVVGDFSWAMIILCLLAIGIAVYTVSVAKKR